MKPVLALILSSLCLPLTAAAERTAAPGLWSYEVNGALGPIPMQEAGAHCLEEAASDAAFETMLNDINPNCHVSDSESQPDGYHFTLKCQGGPEGEMDGRLNVDGARAQLNATGWTGSPQRPVPLSLSASATRVAPSCS